MRIEWEARQIMTKESYRSVKLELLSSLRLKQLLGAKPSTEDANVIHVNSLQRN
jgi:hypothetical protein